MTEEEKAQFRSRIVRTVDEHNLRPTDAHLERMLAVAHEAGMEIGRKRDWEKEGPTYPNFSNHAARALINHEKGHNKSCDDPECECRSHVLWPDNLPCPYIT